MTAPTVDTPTDDERIARLRDFVDRFGNDPSFSVSITDVAFLLASLLAARRDADALRERLREKGRVLEDANRLHLEAMEQLLAARREVEAARCDHCQGTGREYDAAEGGYATGDCENCSGVGRVNLIERAARICESRATSLGEHPAANEARKCAHAIRAALAATPEEK